MLRTISLAGYATGGGSLADPPGTSVVVAAISWLQAIHRISGAQPYGLAVKKP